ncbi:MAG TPA: hypothetical protein VFO91_12795 [Anaerolineales bacterium]|nr:hypothetical protein [Anaerolineales bacterium]
MQKPVNQCLNLIIKDNVDEVVQAFRDTYFWYVRKEFPTKESYEGVLDNFLNRVSETLGQNEYERMFLSEEELLKLSFRPSSLILNVIQEFMTKLEKNDGIDFLGRLIGAYALAVPEPLFRTAKTYSGLHMTPDIPATDDNLPMTDDMILYAWQYDWFYSWLGY